MNIPSIGRIVHYTSTELDGTCVVEPALVVNVHSYAEDAQLDLVVFRRNRADVLVVSTGQLGDPSAPVTEAGRVVFLDHVHKTDKRAGEVGAIYRWNWPEIVGQRPPALAPDEVVLRLTGEELKMVNTLVKETITTCERLRNQEGDKARVRTGQSVGEVLVTAWGLHGKLAKAVPSKAGGG